MNRRHILSGLLAAPMLIRTPGLLMPVRPIPPLPFDINLMVVKCTERWEPVIFSEAVEAILSKRFLAFQQADASPLFRLSA